MTYFEVVDGHLGSMSLLWLVGTAKCLFTYNSLSSTFAEQTNYKCKCFVPSSELMKRLMQHLLKGGEPWHCAAGTAEAVLVFGPVIP
jgi:hypothetical protein